MTKIIKTDVVVNLRNKPFLTLTESKIPNVWYHNIVDKIFMLTSKGFYVKNGSKKELQKLNLL